MMLNVDARGDACPLPVVKAKKAIAALNGAGEVEVLVDNEIAVQNLTKMAQQKGYGSSAEKPFVFSLTQQEKLPRTILFYNGGAHLTCEGSPMLEDLKVLEAEGVEILTCGTCLNFYGLTEKLRIGTVTNMYVIAEKMLNAGNVVKP